MTTRPHGGNLAAVADLPATQPLDLHLDDDEDEDISGTPTASLPTQERNPRQHKAPIQTQIEETPPAAGAAAAAGVNSDSFHRKVNEDYRHHHNQQHQGGRHSHNPEGESMGEGWIPASHQNYSGWSYSDGDDVNIPETSLPMDAEYSHIEGMHVRVEIVPPRGHNTTGFNRDGEDRGNAISPEQQQMLLQKFAAEHQKNLAGKVARPRKGVQDRYPMYQQQQEHSLMPSVAQPSPPPGEHAVDQMKSPNAGGGGAAGGFVTGGGREGARLMPTPQQIIPGSSALQRNITPEEREAMEGRKKAALARKAEVEQQRKKVARNLQFEGVGAGATINTNNHDGAINNQGNLSYQPWQPPAAGASGVQNLSTQFPSIPTLSPAQAQHAEQNRQRALDIRLNKLMEDAVELAHLILASQSSGSTGSGGGGGSGSGLRAILERNVRKVLTEKRHTHRSTLSSGASPSHLSTPSHPGAGGSGGSSSSQLTPEQRQRMEQNKQRALQIQNDKIEQGVREFFSTAMQRAQREVAMRQQAGAGTGGAQQQRQQDQMAHRFL